MRAILSFVAVNALFLAINLVAAGVMWALGVLALRAIPGAEESVATWIAIGVAGVAASVVFAAWVTGRWPARARGRAPG